METRFGIIEDCWVDRYRQVIFSSTCYTAPDGTWRQVRYDNGDIRYVNLDSSTFSPSGLKVRTMSAADWVVGDCPDCCGSGGGGGGGGDASAANQVIGNNTLSNINAKLPPLGPATPANSLSVSVASAALPTGASTAANQSTTNTYLGNVNSAPITNPNSTTANINSLLKGALVFLQGIQPASAVEMVTPSDSINFTRATAALFVGTGGDINIQVGATSALFGNVPNGSRLDVKATRVNATGTSATNIVALFN